MHGQFVWYELTTPDVDGSIAFYPGFTKWGTLPFDENYTMWTTEGAPFAGIFRLTDEMRANGVPPNWMPYVESDDVDATMEQVKALGGAVVVDAADIPGTGRFGVAADPQGAMFGVYKSVRDSGSWDGTPVIGRMSWHELMTTDYQQAYAFYGALFGWAENGAMDMGSDVGMYSMFGHGEAMYGGMFNRPPEMAGVTPFWMLYIHVKDVAKAVKAATKAGATVMRPQMDIPGGSVAILVDPQGAAFAVHHVSGQAAADPSAAPAKDVAGKARDVAGAAKAAVGKALKQAAKVVKGAVSRVKARAKPIARKAASKVPAAKKSAAKKSVARKPATKKATARHAPMKQAPAKKAAAKKAPMKKTPMKKAASRKPARKTASKTRPMAKNAAARRSRPAGKKKR